MPLQLQNIHLQSYAHICAFIYQFIKIQILRIKCSKHKSNHKHENTSDLFCLPCLPVHGTLHANRMQMHLIESGDAEVIVFGEMSKIFFHHYQWGVFFMKSILNKSYHHSRALWSSFVTCGCGCVFNFLSIKSKYTALFFSPTVKSKQEESTWADRWGIFIYICLPVFPFFIVDADDVIQQATPCLHAFYQTHPRVCKRKEKKEKASLPACLVQSWMGKTNKHQTSATQHKLYFIIKWLLIHVSCSYRYFDQSKIVTKKQLFHSSLSSYLSL